MNITLRTFLILLSLPLCAACSEDDTAGGGGIERWARQLPVSGKCSESAAQLARLGPEGLPYLETLTDEATPRLVETIKAILSVALLKSTQPDELMLHGRLLDLVRADIQEGYRVAEALAGAEKYDSGENTAFFMASPPPELSAPWKAIEKLVRLRGFAVPAVQRLAGDPSPASKRYAADILILLVATSQKELLLDLARDGGEISIWHGDYSETTTVGGSVFRRLKNVSPFGYWLGSESAVKAISEPEEYVSELCDERHPDSHTRSSFPVTNTLRHEARTIDAKSWDEYWQRARPVIEKIYRRTRESTRPGSCEAVPDLTG